MTTNLSAGLALKPRYFEEALASSAGGLWFEVHPENYMVEGGPLLAWLDTIRERHPISLHGVAASLAADADPDPDHLRRLRALVERLQPVLVSEHLAWSVWNGAYYPDLLPMPRTSAALARVAANVGRLQDALGCTIAIENPSHYLRFDQHDYGEIEFLTALARRSGCRLLMDVNNVFVSANNLGFAAETYIDTVPGDLVAEIHLAGHSSDPVLGAALLIDSHDEPVHAAIWALFERLIARIGSRPVLIERDDNLPAFETLIAERDRAAALLRLATAEAA